MSGMRASVSRGHPENVAAARRPPGSTLEEICAPSLGFGRLSGELKRRSMTNCIVAGPFALVAGLENTGVVISRFCDAVLPPKMYPARSLKPEPEFGLAPRAMGASATRNAE